MGFSDDEEKGGYRPTPSTPNSSPTLVVTVLESSVVEAEAVVNDPKPKPWKDKGTV